MNAALALAVAHRGFGMDLRGRRGRAGRGAARRAGGSSCTTRADGVTVLNDAYNANPASMDAALRALAAARRRPAGGSRCSATCASSACTATTRTPRSAGARPSSGSTC